MENTTMDMQTSLNAKGASSLFTKEHDKSPTGSRHGQSTAFICLLDAKTAQTINDESDVEKIKEGSVFETTNSDFTGMSTFVPLPVETVHKLWNDAPHCCNDDIKSLPLAVDAQLVAFSLPAIKTSKAKTGDAMKPSVLVLTEMKNHPQTLIQHSSGEKSQITVPLGNKSPLSSDNVQLFHSSTTIENNTESLLESERRETIPQTEKVSGQSNKSFGSSTVYKTTSTPAFEDKVNREMVQSVADQTTMAPNIMTRNKMKSIIPLNTNIKDQVIQAQTNNSARETVSVVSGTTNVDTPLPELDSSSGDRVTNHIRSEKPEHRTEAESINHVAEGLRQKDNKSAVDGIFSELRRMTISHRDNKTDMAVQKEGRYIATATQKPAPAANDRVAGIGQAVSNDFHVELPDKAIFMKSSPAGTNAADQGDKQIWNGAPDHYRKTTNTNRDELPLRTDMANIPSTHGNRLSTTNGPAEINTQAVIDQILDAKQSLNNGFGRVRITLDPPNLGTVNLEIVVRKERVEVVITADNSGVQQALQSRVDDIRTALQRQDLKIEIFQVLLQDNTANQQHANGSDTFGQRQEHQSRQNFMDDNIPVQPLIQPIRESERARGLVSIFV